MITDKLNQDLKAAMIAKDDLRKTTIQGLKSVIVYAKVEKKEDLTDDEIIKLFQKEQKKRLESEKLFRQGGNKESADKEKAEYAIIGEYLPEAASEEDVAKAVEEAIVKTGASTMQDMGKVIGMVTGQLGAAADGAVVARIAKEKLI